MIKVSVMYPNRAGARFDHEYYRDQHMPMVKRLLAEQICDEKGSNKMMELVVELDRLLEREETSRKRQPLTSLKIRLSHGRTSLDFLSPLPNFLKPD